MKFSREDLKSTLSNNEFPDFKVFCLDSFDEGLAEELAETSEHFIEICEEVYKEIYDEKTPYKKMES